MEPQPTSSNHFSLLPTEIIRQIFSYLYNKDLCTVARVCRQWRHLAQDPILWRIVTIGETCDVTEDRCLFRSMPRLQSLTIQRKKCAASIFQHILDYCPGLTALHLRFCQHLDFPLIARYQRLVELDLHSCHEVKNEEIAFLARSLPHVKRLDVGMCIYLQSEGILNAVRCCTTLEALDVTKIKVVDISTLTTIISVLHPSLQELRFSGDFLMSTAYSTLTQCEKLKTLGIIEAASMKDEALAGIIGLKELRHLHIAGGICLTDQGLKNVFESKSEYCTNLLSLSLVHCYSLEDAAVTALAQCCVHLRYLRLDASFKVTEVGLVSILQHCRLLETLSLNYLRRIKGICLQHIPEQLPRLKLLRLHNCDSLEISRNAVLHMLSRMPMLQCEGVKLVTRGQKRARHRRRRQEKARCAQHPPTLKNGSL